MTNNSIAELCALLTNPAALSREIRGIQVKRGLSLSRLAVELGTEPAVLYHHARGQGRPSPYLVAKIIELRAPVTSTAARRRWRPCLPKWLTSHAWPLVVSALAQAATFVLRLIALRFSA